MFSVYKKNRRYLSRRMVAVKPLLWICCKRML